MHACLRESEQGRRGEAPKRLTSECLPRSRAPFAGHDIRNSS